MYTSTRGVAYKILGGGAGFYALDLPGGGGFVHTLAIDPRTAETVYAGGRGVMKSTNGGGSFGLVGLNDADVQALVISPSNPQTIYAGTYSPGGVFRSTDGGGTWQSVGLDNLPVYALGIASSGRVLYAGTDDGVSVLLLGG
jgi:hypothetical protein